MKYKIKITETLQRIVEIDSTSKDSALKQARKLYSDEKIILDSGDYTNTNIEVI